VAASDAFFPFTDCVDVLAEAGICAIVVPAGAKRDAEVLEKAKERGISLIFAHERHFRH
jgi:phosphoribosylaminoimidazolecarboxamide formyltransferase/IMP cyclohydrolase